MNIANSFPSLVPASVPTSRAANADGKPESPAEKTESPAAKAESSAATARDVNAQGLDSAQLKQLAELKSRDREVRAAALAPAEPSSQDRSVAAQAMQLMLQAQSELAVDSGNEDNPEAPSADENGRARVSPEAFQATA